MIQLKLHETVDRKFIDSVKTSKYSVLTEDGYKPVISSNLTIEYEVYEVILEDNLSLKCADDHILIKDDYTEVFAKDSKDCYIRTRYGSKKVLEVKNLGYSENMYDLSIDSEEHTYYTNDILSHNTITIATYLLHCGIFDFNANVGIVANVSSLAREVLDKIKKIFIELPIWMMPGINVWNKGSIEFDNNCKIITAAAGPDACRGFTLKYFYMDEVAFLSNTDFNDTTDAILPAMAAVSGAQVMYSSTANGLNHWYHLVEGARKGKNNFHIVEATWQEVPRYKKDGSVMTPEEFKDKEVRKSGELYFQQNFGNNFLGSSATLVSSEALKNIDTLEDDDIIFNTLFDGLRIFNEPEQGHYYIIAVDPKIDGADEVGIQVLDVTSIPFIQVAAANLKESYLTIPSKVFDLGNYYNKGTIVIENNIDLTIADALFYQYDYEGEIYKEKKKSILGFRTTVKTKKLCLSMLKKFIETRTLLIQDRVTQDQLFNFIEKKNGTFSAEEGYKDDMVMALMLCFAPFLDFKNFDDFKGFVNYLEKHQEQQQEEEKEFEEFLDLGFCDDLGQKETGFTESAWGGNAWDIDPFVFHDR